MRRQIETCGAGRSRFRKTRQPEHGDVVFLTESAYCFNDLLYRSIRCSKSGNPLKTIQFTGFVPRFDHAICVKQERVAFLKTEVEFIVIRVGHHAEWKGPGDG